jgi:hypothetical protein
MGHGKICSSPQNAIKYEFQSPALREKFTKLNDYAKNDKEIRKEKDVKKHSQKTVRVVITDSESESEDNTQTRNPRKSHKTSTFIKNDFTTIKNQKTVYETEMPLYQKHPGTDYSDPIVLKTVISKPSIYLDSCATNLFTPDADGFTSLSLYDTPQPMSGTTGLDNLCVGIGTYKLNFGSIAIIFKNAIYAPSIDCTLVSIPQLESMGYSYSHLPGTRLIEYYSPEDIKKLNPIAVSSSAQQNLHILLPPAEIQNVAYYSTIKSDIPLHLIHKRVCHLNSKMILEMEKNKSVNGLNLNKRAAANDTHCKVCIVSKAKKKPYNNELQRINVVGNKVCVDYKPFGFTNIFGIVGFFMLVDKGSRYGILVNVPNRQSFLDILKNYDATNTKQGYSLQTFKSDGAGEFLSDAAHNWLIQQGIQPEVSAPYGQAENSIVESRIRILLGML